jgi:hypothetical protein
MLCSIFETPPIARPPGILVEDAADAYAQATANGGVGVLAPTRLEDCEGGAGGSAVISEVKLYGDVVLRFVSGDYKVKEVESGPGSGRRSGCRRPVGRVSGARAFAHGVCEQDVVVVHVRAWGAGEFTYGCLEQRGCSASGP